MIVKKSNDQTKEDLTIVICCFNAEQYIRQCLDSIAVQGKTPLSYKVLLINDASTDKSNDIALEYVDKIKNFEIVNNDKNLGLVRCCNEALDKVDTEFFMRLDADDYLSEHALNNVYKQLKCMDGKDFVIFYRIDVIDDQQKKVQITEDIFTWIAAGNVFSSNAVRAVGGYAHEYWEEYDLFTKLMQKGFKYTISSDYIYYYRRGHESMTQDDEMRRIGVESLFRKWPRAILSQYGNFDRLIEYYDRKEQPANA